MWLWCQCSKTFYKITFASTRFCTTTITHCSQLEGFFLKLRSSYLLKSAETIQWIYWLILCSLHCQVFPVVFRNVKNDRKFILKNVLNCSDDVKLIVNLIESWKCFLLNTQEMYREWNENVWHMRAPKLRKWDNCCFAKHKEDIKLSEKNSFCFLFSLNIKVILNWNKYHLTRSSIQEII